MTNCQKEIYMMNRSTSSSTKSKEKAPLAIRLYLSLSLQQALYGLSFKEDEANEAMDRMLIEMVLTAITEIMPDDIEA